ncbi:SNARE associated protein [Clostridium sp. DL-VIII]|uniref:DedA family protein n=1 Tax=Clostridium sp. DL-VIII TaxID=641107 RepID=UPI00023B0606|nr:DedA family protein [Clostridium sp. DL-VIII]EHJ00899.1 SNARE associated protein [Clostridium sp. DL-VIII]
MQTIIELINNYGYIILFFALALELILLPLPGELMMTYCGFLIYKGNMDLLPSILTATAGVTLGITISYITGSTLGERFFQKYGSHFHLGPNRLKKVSSWFDTYGTKLIFLAYYIPGIRHLTGYFSGITKLSYKKFALNAYLGALVWTSTFILLGNFLGLNWYKFHYYSKELTIVIISLAASILLILYIYKKSQISVLKSPYKTMNLLNSIGKIKLALFSIVAMLLGFFAFYNFT